MGENQLGKLLLKKRQGEFGMIRPTLENPDIILEESSEASEGQDAERPSSYLFIKTFNRDGKKIKFYASISVKKDGLEVIISNHFVERKALSKKMQGDRLLYTREALLSNSSDRHLAEQRNAVPDLLPTQESNASSENKDSKNSENASVPEQGTLEFNDNPEVAAEAQVDLNPTDAQKEAGNYQKDHVVIDGHDISIENPKGSVRSGVDADGNPWSVTMNNTYGYIRRTEGVDGDQIDVFLSDNPTEGCCEYLKDKKDLVVRG